MNSAEPQKFEVGSLTKDSSRRPTVEYKRAATEPDHKEGTLRDAIVNLVIGSDNNAPFEGFCLA